MTPHTALRFLLRLLVVLCVLLYLAFTVVYLVCSAGVCWGDGWQWVNTRWFG